MQIGRNTALSRYILILFFLVITTTLLTSCGTEGTDLNGPTSTITGHAVKQLTFTWDAWFGATKFDVKQNPDGNSTFNTIAGGANCSGSTHTTEISVHLTDWNNCQYMVEGSNEGNSLRVPYSPLPLTQAMSAMATGYFKASNTEADDTFGSSVALSSDGKTLAVGASGEDSSATGIGGDQSDNSASIAGAVYIFRLAGATWSQEAYIKASNSDADDRFGLSLALSSDGNTLAVSAFWEDSSATGVGGDQSDNSASNAGAVYVFRRSGSTWLQEAYIKASNTEAGDLFGTSVALSSDGNTLAVSAGYEDSSTTGVGSDQSDNSASFAGAVYLFRRSGATWSQEAYIKASNTEADDLFGFNVALSLDGNTMAVSAFWEDSSATGVGGDQSDNSASNAGAVYVFRRSGSTWLQEAYIKASNTEADDGFGYSLALSSDGNTLAVSAGYEDSTTTGIGGDQSDNSASFAGAVYLFRRSGATWSQEAYIKASNTEADDLFGTSLALSSDGNILAVGALLEGSSAIGVGGDQSDNSVSSGAAYIFRRSGATWSQESYVKSPNTGLSDRFGQSVALNSDGSTLAVGADLEDSSATGVGGDQSDNSESQSGAVYLY